MKRLSRVTAAALWLCLALGSQTNVTVIRGARVIDGTGAPARAATVVIRGSRIEAVSADAPIPEGARVIDAAGQTLLPGLFDLHTHLSAAAANGVTADWAKNLKAYLDCGITTVNDFSAYGEMFGPMRQLLSSGAAPGPRVNLASRFSTPGGHGTEAGWGDAMTLTASTPAEGRARVQAALVYKPDVLKIFTDGWRYGTDANLTSMNVETLTAMVKAAHAGGVKVFTHTVTLEGAKIAARAGVDALAHGIGDAVADQELIDVLKASGTAYIPTLAVYERHVLSRVPDRAASVLEPAVREALARPGTAASEQTLAARAQRWQNLLANVKRLHEAGVPVAAGTDAGMAGTYHGFATLREVELLVEAGMKPLEAITAATKVSAQVLGVQAERGTIAPGQAADLLLVAGRPDESIADIEKTARVFLNGSEVDRAALERAIGSREMTPLAPKPLSSALVDDMEGPRTNLGTLRVNSTDSGSDHSDMLFLPVVRSGKDHALLVSARMAEKAAPFVRLELPLTPGGVEPADASRFTGVMFEVRGEGRGQLQVSSYDVRAKIAFRAPFDAAGEWQTVRIPFSGLQPAVPEVTWNARSLRALYFEIAAGAGASTWLELDNVRFY